MSNEQNIPQLNKNDPDSLYNWIAYKISYPDFRNSIKDFINDNCCIFIDTEENFVEYGQIFKKFNQLINDLIKDILLEGNISKEEFQNMVQRGRKDIKYKKYFKNLTTLKDYSLFKSMMCKRNYEISKMIENKINEQSERKINEQSESKINEQSESKINKQSESKINEQSESKINEQNKKNKNFILTTSSIPINISKNPYALDCQIEEKNKKRTPTPKEIKITIIEKQKDIKKKDENNTPNSIINSLKEIVMNKININIRNIEDEAPIMEEVSDESLDKNL